MNGRIAVAGQTWKVTQTNLTNTTIVSIINEDGEQWTIFSTDQGEDYVVDPTGTHTDLTSGREADEYFGFVTDVLLEWTS